MLLTVALGRHCGGDFDVAGLAAKAVRLCPGGDFTGEQYRHGYALLRLLAAGLAADRFGASVTFIVGSLLLAGSSWAFYHLAGSHPEVLFLLYGVVGLCVGVVGAVPYVMVRAFPPEVRFTGISFSYNVSYAIFGGLTPIAVTVLMGVSPLAPAVCAGVVADGAGVGDLASPDGRMSCPRGGHDRGSVFFTNR